MSVEENKAIVHRLIEEFWNQRNMDVADEILAPNLVNYDSARLDVQSFEDYKRHAISVVYTRYPDSKHTIEDMVAEGDKVAIRWTWHGTRKESGTRVTVKGMGIHRFAGGKIAEIWTIRTNG